MFWQQQRTRKKINQKKTFSSLEKNKSSFYRLRFCFYNETILFVFDSVGVFLLLRCSFYLVLLLNKEFFYAWFSIGPLSLWRFFLSIVDLILDECTTFLYVLFKTVFVWWFDVSTLYTTYDGGMALMLFSVFFWFLCLMKSKTNK